MSNSTLSKTVISPQGGIIEAEPDYTIEAMEEQISLLNQAERKTRKDLLTAHHRNNRLKMDNKWQAKFIREYDRLHCDLSDKIYDLENTVKQQQAMIDSFTPSTNLVNQVVSIHNGTYPQLNQNGNG